jgi:hypothetical protein
LRGGVFARGACVREPAKLFTRALNWQKKARSKQPISEVDKYSPLAPTGLKDSSSVIYVSLFVCEFCENLKSDLPF